MRAAITVLVVLGLVAAAALAVVASDPLARADEALDRAVDEAMAEAQSDLESRRAPAPGRRPPAATPTAESAPRGNANASLPQLFTPDDVKAARSGKQVYYQYSDASGDVHFVPHWEQVPAAYRGRAGRVEMAGTRRAPAARR